MVVMCQRLSNCPTFETWPSKLDVTHSIMRLVAIVINRDSCTVNFISIKVDKNAMIRNRYNRIHILP